MMAANEGWNYLLFRRRSTRASLVGMIGFALITVVLYRVLRRLDQPTARMLLPYLIWLGYDLVWAYELWRLNR
jgi:tryptophan-rich sensory protein